MFFQNFFIFLMLIFLSSCQNFQDDNLKSEKDLVSQKFFGTKSCSKQKNLWGEARACQCQDSGHFYEERLGVCLKGKDFSFKTKLSGVLRSGIMSFGGETTGITLVTSSESYDLYLSLEGKKKAQTLNGNKLSLEGEVFLIEGVERKNRKAFLVDLAQNLKDT